MLSHYERENQVNGEYIGKDSIALSLKWGPAGLKSLDKANEARIKKLGNIF